jgi:DNA ligase-associated metallophosphoesterase
MSPGRYENGMNQILIRMRQGECEGIQTMLAGGHVVCDPSGALYVPDHDLLVVSDLHLEKGAAFARRGMMLPPYDTASTLALLDLVLTRYRPRHVVSLGDSFHDRNGAALMPEVYRDELVRLMSGHEWTWITGNHDPDPPAFLGGVTTDTVTIGPWTFRHEPSAGRVPGEIAGHLHPSAKVAGGGRSVRGACFASDGDRMIMPSFGVTTGGLNVLHEAFDGLFKLGTAQAYVIGVRAIYPIAFTKLTR